MNIQENKNFVSVSLYSHLIKIDELLSEELTGHLSSERYERLERAMRYNKFHGKGQAYVDKVFVVDKGHPDGPELHCVTTKGIIFILNKDKYESHKKSFITVLLARPNQVKRLYEACGLEVPLNIMNFAERNQEHHENY